MNKLSKGDIDLNQISVRQEIRLPKVNKTRQDSRVKWVQSNSEAVKSEITTAKF